MKELPKVVYISYRNEKTSDEYLDVSRTAVGSIEDDGPTVIGEYKLVRKMKMEKRATEV